MKKLIFVLLVAIQAISCEKDDVNNAPSVTQEPTPTPVAETWSEWTPDFENQTENFIQSRTSNTGGTEERELVLTRNVIDDRDTCCYQEQQGTGDVNGDGDLEDWLISQEVYYTATVDGSAISSNTPIHDEFEVAKDFSGNFIEDFTNTAFVKQSRHDYDLLEFNEDLSYTISPLKFGPTNNYEICWDTPEVSSIIGQAGNIGWAWSGGGQYFVYSPDITWNVEVEGDKIRYVFNLDTTITTLAGDLERLDQIGHWDRDYIKSKIQEKIDNLDSFVIEIRREFKRNGNSLLRVRLKTVVSSKRNDCVNEFTGAPEECSTHSYSTGGSPQYYYFQYEIDLLDPDAPVNTFLPEELPSDPLAIDRCN